MRRLMPVLLLASLLAPGALPAAGEETLTHFVGGLHTHTGYSDGQPGTTPADAYAAAHGRGLDFLAVTEHSEALGVPMTLSEGCFDGLIACALADDDPLAAAGKWDAQRRQAAHATVPDDFLALRGFEWTSDTFGHVNVYFSRNYATRLEGGEATVESFYRWLQTPPLHGGGADGLATFNHPGDKDLAAEDPRRNWNDFEYRPELAERIVGIEVFNRARDRYFDDVVRALDKGWHLGLVGAEDIHETNWGDPAYGRTVFLAEELTPAALKHAMSHRRMYATLDPDVRIAFTADGQPMGTRFPPGGTLRIEASATGADIGTLELVSNGGEVVAEGVSLTADVPRLPNRWYLLRVRDAAGEVVAYGSPVRVDGGAAARVCRPQAPCPGQDFEPGWVAGDLHVHTTWSHDSYGGVHDHNTTLEEDGYTLGWAPGEQMAIAESRGLDYLALTDHNNTFSVFDPGSTSDRVTLVPAYEKSLAGHVQMLGARSCYTPDGRTAVVDECPRSNDPAWVRGLADAIRRDGGVFQVNHPSDGDWIARFGDGSAADPIVPDSVEVWNIGPWHWQPPMPSGNDNDFSLRFWETYLNAGYKVAATGGSDNHWRSTTAAQGVGQPTTWVYVTEPGVQGILDGIRAGRTTISHLPPGYGGARLFLEAGDGFQAMVGDTVGAGAPMRVRVQGALPGALFRIVTDDGYTEVPVPPDGVLVTAVPAGTTWVRAELRRPDAQDERTALCGPSEPYCRNRLVLEALSSPLYVAAEP